MSEESAIRNIPTKILLPIDFSPSSEAALEMGADLALHFHAELHIVHVIPTFPTTTIPDFIPEAAFIQEVRETSERHLAKCVATYVARGVKATSSVESGNDVASAIIDAIEREGTDFVVISTHGLSGWQPVVFGSIAEKVVKLVQCPLLLLRSAKPDSGVKIKSDRLMEWW
jgi:nucleotide-binding universal stress UspA family protein